CKADTVAQADVSFVFLHAFSLSIQRTEIGFYCMLLASVSLHWVKCSLAVLIPTAYGIFSGKAGKIVTDMTDLFLKM
ncbi:MAG: hypothetical protein RR085_03970, partial [Clostridia bacterium]